MDIEAALNEINSFIALIDARNADFTPAREIWDEQILQKLTLIKMIGERLYPGLEWRTVGSTSVKWTWIRESAITIRGWILDMENAAAILGPSGPQLSATTLHAWVWDAAVSLWDRGAYRQAVHAAATNVEEQLKGKLDRYDVSGTALVNAAFTLNDASEEHPRLRSTDIDPARVEDWNSFHNGAREFGAGCMLLVRNLATHGVTDMAEQAALERLAALSVLAHTIDSCEVVRN